MPVFSCITSLYMDWRMVVVVGGNVLHHVKREGKLSGRGKCPGADMSGGIMSRGNVRIPLPSTLLLLLLLLPPHTLYSTPTAQAATNCRRIVSQTHCDFDVCFPVTRYDTIRYCAFSVQSKTNAKPSSSTARNERENLNEKRTENKIDEHDELI